MKQPNSVPTSELMLRETASQTAGPYVHIGLALAAAGNPTRDEEIWNEMAKPGAEGELIEVVGTVIDGNGDLVRDAFLEVLYAAPSRLSIVPLQDVLGQRERINVPGTVADTNWAYRAPLSPDDLLADRATTERLSALAARTSRGATTTGVRARR